MERDYMTKDQTKLILNYGFEALKWLVMVFVAVIAWNVKTTLSEIHSFQETTEQRLRDIETWKASTSANRFTSTDALRAQQVHMEEHTAVRKEMAELRLMMPNEVPPEWFREKVDNIEKRVNGLEKTAP
jgi:hypothetical protein